MIERGWIGACGKVVAVAVACLALLASMAPGAQATYDPVGSGSTKITFDQGLLALLKRNGVRLSATGGAAFTGQAVSFPVSGGKFDPSQAKGTVDHDGTLLFRAGTREVPLRGLLLKTTQRHAPFSVKVGGGQLKLAEAKKPVISRRGFGSKIKVSALALTAKVATRLGKKLHLRGVLKPGQPLGTAVTIVAPETIALVGKGSLDLDLDPAFVAKLQSLFVAVNPIFPAEHPGPFLLPIFGGTVAPDASAGRLATQGALEFLQLGGGQVFWREVALDFAGRSITAEVEVDPSPPYGGKLGPINIAGFGIGSVLAKPRPRTVSLVDGVMTLGAGMATLFNEVFAAPQGKTNVFLPDERLATVHFIAQGE